LTLTLRWSCLRSIPPAPDAAVADNGDDGGGGDVGDDADVLAMYCRISLEASVLPAPDSPDISTHWSVWSRRIDRYATSATA